MTALATNKPRPFDATPGNALPILTSTVIYHGSAVGQNSATGEFRALVSGDRFMGFAQSSVNTVRGAQLDTFVNVLDAGQVQLPVSGALATSVGAAVYATDDNTFTLTPDLGSFVGHIKRFVSTGVALVQFNASGYRNIVVSSSAPVDADGRPDGTIYIQTA